MVNPLTNIARSGNSRYMPTLVLALVCIIVYLMVYRVHVLQRGIAQVKQAQPSASEVDALRRDVHELATGGAQMKAGLSEVTRMISELKKTMDNSLAPKNAKHANPASHGEPLQVIQDVPVPLPDMQTGYVVITAASSAQFDRLRNFVGSVHFYDKNQLVIVYDLGLTGEQREQLRCWDNVDYRVVPFDQYPPHVAKLNSFAWRPAIVYDAISRFGTVLYLDAGSEVRRSLRELWRWLEVDRHLFVHRSTDTLGEKVSAPMVQQILSKEKAGLHPTLLASRMVAAAVQGWSVDSVAVDKVLVPCLRCMMNPNCVASADEVKGVHQPDEDCMSLLVRHHGLHVQKGAEFAAALPWAEGSGADPSGPMTDTEADKLNAIVFARQDKQAPYKRFVFSRCGGLGGSVGLSTEANHAPYHSISFKSHVTEKSPINDKN